MEYNFITTINNKRIYDFYNANQNISIETINLIILDLIEEINADMSKVFVNTKLGEILENVKDMKKQVNIFNDNLSNVIQDHNKSFIETFKLIIGNASNESNEKIVNMLTKNTDHFIERINFVLPKTQDETNIKIQETLFSFQKSINEDIRTFLHASHSDNNLKDFISTIESKIQLMQQPIYNIISTNQEQINNKLSAIKEENSIAKNTYDKSFGDLNDFLNKYKNSSQFKGQISENTLNKLLVELYPTAEVINTTGSTACGDFMLKRNNNKPTILFENKNYLQNINIEESKKFIRDVLENKCSGVMISQNSGIVGKPDFFIEIHDGNVLIYLHNVNYSKEKIKTAVDIIDNLSDRLSTITQKEGETGVSIKKETLDRINEQFQLFKTQKEMLINTSKDIQKRLITQIEDMNMPDLKMFLDDKYASIQNQEFICTVCNQGFLNKKALASHKKAHSNKGKKNISDDEENEFIIDGLVKK
jgi:cytochrome c556